GKINWERLKEVVEIGTRILDNVVDITEFPVDRVNNVFRKNRRIGLGVMGFADFLFQLEIPYNLEEGFKTGEKVMKFINKTSHETSQKLAEQKGVFENYDLSIWKKKGIKMRNAACTCIAPTGTISMIPEVSSGIEPYFALAFTKQQVMGNQEFYYVNPYLKEKLREEGLYSPEMIDKIYRAGSIQKVEEVPEEIKRIFVGAMDVSPEDHIKMDAAFQKYVDNSISKTINLPNNSTRFDVTKAINLAWESKCKAFTVYRSGSREEEVLKTGNENTSGECLTCGI
ncbi:ribonucleotide-diphosphate reductase subunit alpha, partial [Candidatus Wolfebacteria bacterium CG03_land_8_20_14_0_80_36_15]